MRILVIAAGLVAGLATTAVADPSSLLAPDDPANGSGWTPPAAATDGLETFAPVEAKNWIELNRGAEGRPTGATDGMDKPMPGMKGGKDRGGMPGMEHGQ